MRAPWLLLLLPLALELEAVGQKSIGDAPAVRQYEPLDEDQYARRLIALTHGHGFINRVFDKVTSALSDIFTPIGRQPVDRQGVATFIIPIIGLTIATAIGVAVAVAVAQYVTDVIASGRGMTADDWEISHSAWLEQLQRDLELSWQPV